MTRFRRVPRILLVLLLAFVGVACAKPTPTPEPVAIRFACLEADVAYYEPLVAEFSRSHPNVVVTLLPKSWQNLDRTGPGEADVLLVRGGLNERIEQGAFLSLDVWLSADESFDKADFYPGMLPLFARDGKTWAVPVAADVMVMYYNQDLFDERGLAYPSVGWTWDEFLNAAINLRDTATGLYGFAPINSSEYILPFVMAHGGQLVDSWQNPTRVGFDDPQVIEAVDRYASLIYDYGVSPTDEEARQSFGGGQYAIYSGILAGRFGLWADLYSTRGGLTWPQQWEFAWGATTIPRAPEAASMALMEALAISSEAEQPEACWQWVSFLSRRVPGRLAPVRRSLAESKTFEEQAGADVAAAVHFSLEDATIIPPDMPALYYELGPVWDRAIKAVLSGELLALEALSQAQYEVDR